MPIPAVPTESFLMGLPKAELHLHVEGTLEPDLKLELAAKNNIELDQKTIEEVEASYQFNDLSSFLAVYYPAMNVLQTEDDFYALAMAYFRRAAENGVKRTEMFFDPQAHTTRGVPFADVVNGYYRATQDAADLGISAELIMCFLRDMSAESAAEHLEMSVPFADKILGLGLDSDERDNPPAKFAEVFARGRELGYKLTMHCDIDQVGSIENIRQVIEDVQVDRIDHGTNIVENPELVAIVKEKGLGLTCCPVSNSFVTEDMKATEITSLLREGVKVTLNSDDPAYFGGYIGKNYVDYAAKSGVSTAEMIQIAKNSFDVSWISDEENAKYFAAIDEYVASFEG
ncbi:adenosine deaminase [Timonella senegalensis]|uniref:adenosine deaminase n=1 Tax=Timonella senegalensis TaxID=1465825 RepID=UPI0028AD0460|nr:adenosine deaminase [Timonella senegalensis]